MLKSIPSSPLHAPLFIKLIDFNEKVVSDVTSETTFSLKSIYIMKREDERGMKGACVAPLVLITSTNSVSPTEQVKGADNSDSDTEQAKAADTKPCSP